VMLRSAQLVATERQNPIQPPETLRGGCRLIAISRLAFPLKTPRIV
jgi:hypothetical protein